MPLTPNPQYDPVRKFESGEPSTAALFNGVAQSLLNGAAWIEQSCIALKAQQASNESAIAALSEYVSLNTQLNNLNSSLDAAALSASSADSTITGIEGRSPALSASISTQQSRVAGIQTALNAISIGSNFQAQSAILSAIATAPRNNNTFLYSDAAGAVSWSNPPALGSGTRMLDCTLKGIIAAGNAGPALATGNWTNAPIAQIYNKIPSKVSWDAGTNTLTLGGGEYIIEGFFVARSPLVQMCLRATSGGAILWGTTAKGTTDSAIVSATEPVSFTSHLAATLRLSSSQSFNPQYYLASPGNLLTNTMNLRTVWYSLNISYFEY